MFRFFKRREDKFSRLIEEQASHSLEGLKLLVKYLETQDRELADCSSSAPGLRAMPCCSGRGGNESFNAFSEPTLQCC
jgi:hypothetical protein